jgi:hypothetical protein
LCQQAECYWDYIIATEGTNSAQRAKQQKYELQHIMFMPWCPQPSVDTQRENTGKEENLTRRKKKEKESLREEATTKSMNLYLSPLHKGPSWQTVYCCICALSYHLMDHGHGGQHHFHLHWCCQMQQQVIAPPPPIHHYYVIHPLFPVLDFESRVALQSMCWQQSRMVCTAALQALLLHPLHPPSSAVKRAMIFNLLYGEA